jgi:hypothetical protein
VDIFKATRTCPRYLSKHGTPYGGSREKFGPFGKVGSSNSKVGSNEKSRDNEDPKEL